jgi:hypothetical protein
MGSTKAKWRGNQLAFYDGTTYETVKPIAPIVFYDDFLGTVINTDFWTDLDLNGATTTAPALSVFDCALGANNENQAAACYGKDDKAFDIGKGLIFETRLAVTVAAVDTGEIGFGVMNDSYGAASMRFMLADEVAKYAFFGFYTTVGAGLIPVIRTDDGTHDSGIVSSGIAAVTLAAYHVYRIDFTSLEDVKFYIDGVGVATGTTFVMHTAASLTVQPWLCVYKHDGNAGLGSIKIDYVKIWQATR